MTPVSFVRHSGPGPLISLPRTPIRRGARSSRALPSASRASEKRNAGKLEGWPRNRREQCDVSRWPVPAGRSAVSRRTGRASPSTIHTHSRAYRRGQKHSGVKSRMFCKLASPSSLIFLCSPVFFFGVRGERGPIKGPKRSPAHTVIRQPPPVRLRRRRPAPHSGRGSGGPAIPRSSPSPARSPAAGMNPRPGRCGPLVSAA